MTTPDNKIDLFCKKCKKFLFAIYLRPDPGDKGFYRIKMKCVHCNFKNIFLGPDHPKYDGNKPELKPPENQALGRLLGIKQ